MSKEDHSCMCGDHKLWKIDGGFMGITPHAGDHHRIKAVKARSRDHPACGDHRLFSVRKRQ